MLVLTRKLMEKLVIGDDVFVTVVRIEGGQVRLGIEAPREVGVFRAELLAEPNAESPTACARTESTTPGADLRSRSTGTRGNDNRRPERSR